MVTLLTPFQAPEHPQKTNITREKSMSYNKCQSGSQQGLWGCWRIRLQGVGSKLGHARPQLAVIFTSQNLRWDCTQVFDYLFLPQGRILYQPLSVLQCTDSGPLHLHIPSQYSWWVDHLAGIQKSILQWYIKAECHCNETYLLGHEIIFVLYDIEMTTAANDHDLVEDPTFLL